MSGVNGDKAKFNIKRKKKIHQRMQSRVTFAASFKQVDGEKSLLHGKVKVKTT